MLELLPSGLYRLVLPQVSFQDQPQAWQNMIHHLTTTDREGMKIDYYHVVIKHLATYNLVIEGGKKFNPIVDDFTTVRTAFVVGSQEDLLAWQLTYS